MNAELEYQLSLTLKKRDNLKIAEADEKKRAVMVSKIIPGKIIPKEMREGCGDGLVSAASSVLPNADEHLNFPVNHASVLFDKRVRDYILRSVEKF